MPSGALRVSAISPAAPRRYARADVVPQSIAIRLVLRDSVTARDGSRRRGWGQAKATGRSGVPAARPKRDAQPDGSAGVRQRAAASSSLARASTQRAPADVSSFFQNGARVLR